MKNKKLLFASLLIMTVVLSIWLSFKYSKKSYKPSPSPSSLYTNPPQPSLPVYSKNPTVVYEVPSFMEKLPDAMTGLSVFSEDKTKELKKIAALFDFQQEPIVSERSNNSYFTWSNDDVYLEIGIGPQTISYGSLLAKDSPMVSLSDADYDSVVKSFIKKYGLLPDYTSLSTPTVKYIDASLPAGKAVTREAATLVQLDYRVLYENFPLITGSVDTSFVVFKISGDGQILSVGGTFYPFIKPLTKNYSLLPVAAAVEKLRKGEGILSSVMSPADINSEYSVFYSFKDIKVTGVSLGYYGSSNNELLSPVYLFKGQAVDENTKKLVDTVTIVSAVK